MNLYKNIKFKTFQIFLVLILILNLNITSSQNNVLDGTITLNFIDSNLEDVVKGISAITGKKFLIAQNLKNRKINLVTDKPIPARRIYSFLLTALRSQKLTIIESDGINNIVPETEAWSSATLINSVTPDSKIVSKVFYFKNINASIAANIIRPFLSQKGFPLVANSQQNSLVVVDYADNLRNLDILIRSIDDADEALPVIFPLTHISAYEAETSLINMLEKSTQVGNVTLSASFSENITADINNNRLLIKASPKRLSYISKLLSFIDIPRKSAEMFHIYHLKFANAETIAKTLSGILDNRTPSITGNGQASKAATTTTTNGKHSGGIIEIKSSSDIKIQADPATNSIIVIAPEVLYRNILSIIKKLDVRRRQIFVEVLIAEIQGERTDEFSVQWLNARGFQRINSNSISGIGASQLGDTTILDVARNPTNIGKGASLGVIRGQVTIPGVGQVLNLGMLARALETRLNANILSSPNLLVLNNEESKLSVGSNVPVVTGQYSNSDSGASNPFQTIERKDVGVTLKIKPQIMDTGVILLDIFQEVSDIISVSERGPTTSKRSIESRVLLNDGQTVVLGGLISDKTNDTISKVPILGDIPILGGLFRSTKKEHKKTNMLLFLRPTILKDEHDVSELSDRKYLELYNKLPYKGDDLRGMFYRDNHKVLPPLPENHLNYQSFSSSLPQLQFNNIKSKNKINPPILNINSNNQLQAKSSSSPSTSIIDIVDFSEPFAQFENDIIGYQHEDNQISEDNVINLKLEAKRALLKKLKNRKNNGP